MNTRRIEIHGFGPQPVKLEAFAHVVMAQTSEDGGEVVSIAHGGETAVLKLAATLIGTIRTKYGEAVLQRVLQASHVPPSSIHDIALTAAKGALPS